MFVTLTSCGSEYTFSHQNCCDAFQSVSYCYVLSPIVTKIR